jgi:hypothetical protein
MARKKRTALLKVAGRSLSSQENLHVRACMQAQRWQPHLFARHFVVAVGEGGFGGKHDELAGLEGFRAAVPRHVHLVAAPLEECHRLLQLKPRARFGLSRWASAQPREVGSKRHARFTHGAHEVINCNARNPKPVAEGHGFGVTRDGTSLRSAGSRLGIDLTMSSLQITHHK